MMRRGLLGLILAATTLSAPALAAPCPDPVKVGWEPWPPFQIAGEEGEPKGIDPDILREIGKLTGCEITFHETPWKRHLRMVEAGKLDVAPAASKTAERDAYSKWTTSYLPYQAILWTSADDDGSYEDLEDFLKSGKSVGIIRGVSLGEEADALLEQPAYRKNVIENKSTKLNIRQIAAGRMDALIDNSATTGHLARQEGLRDKLRATDVAVQSEPIYFMFSDTSTSQETIAAFNEAIGQLKASGKIQEIVDKYTN
jgi:polar amino acid transport system substrate-binding protein